MSFNPIPSKRYDRYYIGIYNKLVYTRGYTYESTPMIIYELQANTVRHILGVF